ncbi:hypothetical protein ACTMTF_41185 [Nonomuraea sp. ZG12]|uniref:hypothetical protein n=1 Tax=Nonomuraea sp. ZG12 TaxID=3452207 RepID=UPI003F8BC35A
MEEKAGQSQKISETCKAGLAAASDEALRVRALYEQVERRVLDRTWTLPELAVGFTNDAAYVGRLVLAAERTWNIDGDVDAELRHKLAECLWWIFVLAERLGVDLPEAYPSTMDRIRGELERAVSNMSA